MQVSRFEVFSRQNKDNGSKNVFGVTEAYMVNTSKSKKSFKVVKSNQSLPILRKTNHMKGSSEKKKCRKDLDSRLAK